MHTSVQQEMARAERLRLSHKRTHKCKSSTCQEARKLKQIVLEGEKLLDMMEHREVQPKGTLPEVRQKIMNALAQDDLAKSDPLIFAMLVYEVLEPGEVLLVESFEKYDAEAATKWANDMLTEVGVKFEFDAALFSEFPI
jgi:hypothetical protein